MNVNPWSTLFHFSSGKWACTTMTSFVNSLYSFVYLPIYQVRVMIVTIVTAYNIVEKSNAILKPYQKNDYGYWSIGLSLLLKCNNDQIYWNLTSCLPFYTSLQCINVYNHQIKFTNIATAWWYAWWDTRHRRIIWFSHSCQYHSLQSDSRL